MQQAADAPRFHHQYLPDVLQVEKAFPLDVVDKLKAAGYTVTRNNEADEHNPGVWGDSEMIYIDPKTGTLLGGHDQRHTLRQSRRLLTRLRSSSHFAVIPQRSGGISMCRTLLQCQT